MKTFKRNKTITTRMNYFTIGFFVKFLCLVFALLTISSCAFFSQPEIIEVKHPSQVDMREHFYVEIYLKTNQPNTEAEYLVMIEEVGTTNRPTRKILRSNRFSDEVISSRRTMSLDESGRKQFVAYILDGDRSFSEYFFEIDVTERRLDMFESMESRTSPKEP